jgi:O-antigen/teichoic acid export membrane protein
LFAAYAEFFQQGAHGIEHTLRLARRLLLPSAAYSGLAFIALATGAPLIGHVLGDEFAETVEVIRLLAVIPLLRSMQVFVADALTGAGYQSWRTSLQSVVAVGNVVANLLLIPMFSWRGAAMASVLSDGCLTAGMWMLAWFAVRRERGASRAETVAVIEPPLINSKLC